MSAPDVQLEAAPSFRGYWLTAIHLVAMLVCGSLLPPMMHQAVPAAFVLQLLLAQAGLIGIAASLSTAAIQSRLWWTICAAGYLGGLAWIGGGHRLYKFVMLALITAIAFGMMLRLCTLSIRRIRTNPISVQMRFRLADLFAATATIAIALAVARLLVVLRPHSHPHVIDQASEANYMHIALLFGVSPYVAMGAALSNFASWIRAVLGVLLGFFIGGLMQVVQPYHPDWFWPWMVLGQGSIVLLTCLAMRSTRYRIVGTLPIADLL